MQLKGYSAMETQTILEIFVTPEKRGKHNFNEIICTLIRGWSQQKHVVELNSYSYTFKMFVVDHKLNHISPGSKALPDLLVSLVVRGPSNGVAAVSPTLKSVIFISFFCFSGHQSLVLLCLSIPSLKLSLILMQLKPDLNPSPLI